MVCNLQHLICPACGTVYPHDQLQTVCNMPDCGSTLFATYSLPKNKNFGYGYAPHLSSMWKYFTYLPVKNPANIISLGEGLTPVVKMHNLALQYPENEIWVKDESANPTGSFKARGISAAASKAKELGVTDLAVPTAGNAGGALAAYAARGGMSAHVFMPKATPQAFKDECRLFGAEVTEINGNISDCSKTCHELALKNNWFELSTLKEPYRLEGKKTMGYEILEQFKNNMPDTILYPTGGGTGLIGIWKAFQELKQLGWISGPLPKMVAVQSESCSSIISAFHKQLPDAIYQDLGFTIANGLRVPKSYASSIILDILRISKGNAISVNDAEMEVSLKELAAKEGLLIAPEGAALWAAFKKLHQQNWIKPAERILLLNTGGAYKYFDNLKI